MLMQKLRDFVPDTPLAPLPAFAGAQSWRVLRVTPMREVRTAERLKIGNLLAYLPTYSKKVRRRGSMHCHRLYAAVVGMLFIPDEMLDVPRRDELFEFAGVHGFFRVGLEPVRLSRDDIEKVRIMEAKLNLPPEAKGVLFKTGQEVRFTSDLFAYSWCGGKIFEIVDEARIGVEVAGLFGCTVRVYVPASEIEAL